MNRRFLGIKLSTYLFALLSVVCAIVFWLYAKSVGSGAGDAAGAFSVAFMRLLRIL